MCYYKNLKKFIAITVIIAFAFQSDIFLHSQRKDEIKMQFEKAKEAYIDGQYDSSKIRLERTIGIINRKKLERKNILGQCYLFPGAIYEKEEKTRLAEKHYNKAKKEYAIQSVEGVRDLENLTIYKRVVKGIIEHEGEKRKKKFPWLLVVGGVIVVAVVAILLLKKKKKKKYTLIVTWGDGVEGIPNSGTKIYDEGFLVDYSYSLQRGYSNLLVLLDGIEVPSSGTVKMNTDHTLRATADELNFVTDKVNFSIPEGSIGYFNVKLSVQPPGKIDVEVFRESGDEDITVVSGATFTFTTSNWNTYQTVTLHAAEDNDDRNSWAIVAITALEIPKETVTVIESDNDKDNALDISISN